MNKSKRKSSFRKQLVCQTEKIGPESNLLKSNSQIVGSNLTPREQKGIFRALHFQQEAPLVQ